MNGFVLPIKQFCELYAEEGQEVHYKDMVLVLVSEKMDPVFKSNDPYNCRYNAEGDVVVKDKVTDTLYEGYVFEGGHDRDDMQVLYPINLYEKK